MQVRIYERPVAGSSVCRPRWLEPLDCLKQAAVVLRLVRSFGDSLPYWRMPNELAPRESTHGFKAAVELYEDGCWEAAYAASVLLANAGHPVAAKLALLMLRHGAALYGVQLQSEPRQIARWATLVLKATSAANEATQRTPRSTSRRTASPSSITAIA